MSCSTSVSSTNGVTTTTQSSGCKSASCSVSVTTINGSTTTTKSPGCDVAAKPDLTALQKLFHELWVWFRFNAAS